MSGTAYDAPPGLRGRMEDAELEVLRWLARHAPVAVKDTELAHELGLDAAATRRALDALHAAGQVEVHEFPTIGLGYAMLSLHPTLEGLRRLAAALPP
jgi:DNA-binding IclR family transcriptional regulator